MKKSPLLKRGNKQAILVKASDFLFLSEPVWVLIAANFVYISIILNWATFIPWLCIALILLPFLIRLIRYGQPSRRSPFDIPIAILLGGIITGIVVSDYFDTSLGAFQTFLAAAGCYYSFVNYHKPSWLVVMWLIAATLIVIITVVLGATWFFSDTKVPNGLSITLSIIAAIALGITLFSGRVRRYAVIGVSGLLLAGMAILFTNEPLHRLFTLVSIEGRLELWLKVITPIEGSALWSGLGLGCWPLIETTRFGHVHNAYLETYVNTGLIGLVAFVCFLAVGAKLAADILYSPRNNTYYGFGAGVILASLVVLAIGFIESVPFGYGAITGDNYHYILSPVPFILAAALVVARRLLREGSTTENTERTQVIT